MARKNGNGGVFEQELGQREARKVIVTRRENASLVARNAQTKFLSTLGFSCPILEINYPEIETGPIQFRSRLESLFDFD